MAIHDRKGNLLGTLSAFQTIIERYPKLVVGNYFSGRDNTLTALSFSLDILKILGISDEFLYDWLSKLLITESSDGVEKGLLAVLETSIRTIVLTYLNGLYTCQVNPMLPDEFLADPYRHITPEKPVLNEGYTIPISEIDAFGLLQNCPVDKDGVGSVFYFDVKDFNASTVYRSTDFNAYLWYVINRGATVLANNAHITRNVWDNRWFYLPRFKDPDTGDMARRVFVDTMVDNGRTVRMVPTVGMKKEILYCEFVETAMSDDTTLNRANNSNAIRVWGMAGRYYRSGLGYETNPHERSSHALNKSIFQFNADYLSGVKLFDSKTIVASVINSLLGFSKAASGYFSFDMNLLSTKIESMVEEVITKQVNGDPDTHDADYYFKFSDEKYSDVLDDATLRYSGRYVNEDGEYQQADYDYVIERLKEIDEAETPEDMENAIKEALLGVKRTVDYGEDKWGLEWSVSMSKDLVFKFIKEVMVQIALQLLSPKLMLIFSINARFLGEDVKQTTSAARWESFFKDFWNVFRSCIEKIVDLVLQELLDLIISQIRPIVDLILKKLLLETIIYYRMALELLLTNCVFPIFNFNNNRSNFVIDNVRGADIIPKQTSPE